MVRVSHEKLIVPALAVLEEEKIGDADSDDSDVDVEDQQAIDVALAESQDGDGKAPGASGPAAKLFAHPLSKNKLENRLQQKRDFPVEKRGVLYIGHLPRGFCEPQLKQFFCQFGQVTRLRVARSKNTGRSKGYAFLEFELKEIAEVVRDTMHNYMLYGKSLKLELIEDVRGRFPRLFQAAGKHIQAQGRKNLKTAKLRHNGRVVVEDGKEKLVVTKRQEKRSAGKQGGKKRTLKELLGVDVADILTVGKEEGAGFTAQVGAQSVSKVAASKKVAAAAPVAEIKAVAAEKKPVVAEKKPVVAEKKPVVAEKKPVAAEKKAVVAEKKPAAAPVAEKTPAPALVKKKTEEPLKTPKPVKTRVAQKSSPVKASVKSEISSSVKTVVKVGMKKAGKK